MTTGAILTVDLDHVSILMLRNAGLIVEECDHGGEFDIIDWSDRSVYDLLVVHLDNAGGMYLCRELRRKGNNIPVIGIQKQDHKLNFSEQRAMFMENGGDDLLPNPLNPRELVASSRAILRRVYDQAAVDVFYIECAGSTIRCNLQSGMVHVNDIPMHLTQQESRVMILLATRTNRVVSKDMILNYLYADRPNDVPEIKIVDVFICKLRKKISNIVPNLGAALISTVWGRGYSIEAKQIKEVPDGTSKAA